MLERLKKLLNKLIRPHIAVIIVTVPAAAALLVYSFVYEEETSVISCVSYLLSAYALTILCMKIPLLIRKIKVFRMSNRYISRYVADTQLRVKISLYGSLMFNTAYAIFQLGLGFYHASVWFYSLAAYHILLAVMRFFLLRDVRSFAPGADIVSELRRYRFCGIILLVMNLALAIVVFYIAWWKRGFVHHPITTIAMATYTFSSLTMAVVNVVKYRKYRSPVYSAVKTISLASALVSVLTLETAMFSAFGETDNDILRSVMTSSTGIAVCLFILVMAVFMIVSSSVRLGKVKGTS